MNGKESLENLRVITFPATRVLSIKHEQPLDFSIMTLCSGIMKRVFRVTCTHSLQVMMITHQELTLTGLVPHTVTIRHIHVISRRFCSLVPSRLGDFHIGPYKIKNYCKIITQKKSNSIIFDCQKFLIMYVLGLVPYLLVAIVQSFEFKVARRLHQVGGCRNLAPLTLGKRIAQRDIGQRQWAAVRLLASSPESVHQKLDEVRDFQRGHLISRNLNMMLLFD